MSVISSMLLHIMREHQLRNLFFQAEAEAREGLLQSVGLAVSRFIHTKSLNVVHRFITLIRRTPGGRLRSVGRLSQHTWNDAHVLFLLSSMSVDATAVSHP